MLSRAGRRQFALRRLRLRHEPLALPWLCPALLQLHHQQTQARLTATSAIASSDRNQLRRPSHQLIRHYATAISEQSDSQSIYVPFEGQDSSLGSPPSLSSLDSRAWFYGQNAAERSDAASVIILKDYPCSRPKSIRRSNGIGGDMEEMFANFDVSLSVGMFDRAALLVRRMSLRYAPDSQQARDIHNKYIDKLVNYMIANQRPDMAPKTLRWFEVDMKSAGVTPDATTFALLLKMALRMLHGTRLHRTVYRYWRMVTEAGEEEAVISSPVFSTADLGLLSEVGVFQH